MLPHSIPSSEGAAGIGQGLKGVLFAVGQPVPETRDHHHSPYQVENMVVYYLVLALVVHCKRKSQPHFRYNKVISSDWYTLIIKSIIAINYIQPERHFVLAMHLHSLLIGDDISSLQALIFRLKTAPNLRCIYLQAFTKIYSL